MVPEQSLEIDHISFCYPGGMNPALTVISCSFSKGEITALVGPSASGKSTFGLIVKGLIEADSGEIRIITDAGKEIAASPGERLKLVGWAGAHPEMQIFASSVHDEVAFGPFNQGIREEELERVIHTALELVGLNPYDFINKHPYNLSGGEKRLVALASIIAMKFGWFVLDEPTAGLDYHACEKVSTLAHRLAEEGHGVCWITHDVDTVSKVAHRIWEFRRGSLITDGMASESLWESVTHRLETGAGERDRPA